VEAVGRSIFFEKREAKNFCQLGASQELAVQYPNQTNKSFLLPFFKKEGFSSFLILTEFISL